MQSIKALAVETHFEFGVPRSPKSTPSKAKAVRKQKTARNGKITSQKYRAQAHVSKREATDKKLTEKRWAKISTKAVTCERKIKCDGCGW